MRLHPGTFALVGLWLGCSSLTAPSGEELGIAAPFPPVVQTEPPPPPPSPPIANGANGANGDHDMVAVAAPPQNAVPNAPAAKQGG